MNFLCLELDFNRILFTLRTRFDTNEAFHYTNILSRRSWSIFTFWLTNLVTNSFYLFWWMDKWKSLCNMCTPFICASVRLLTFTLTLDHQGVHNELFYADVGHKGKRTTAIPITQPAFCYGFSIILIEK